MREIRKSGSTRGRGAHTSLPTLLGVGRLLAMTRLLDDHGETPGGHGKVQVQAGGAGFEIGGLNGGPGLVVDGGFEGALEALDTRYEAVAEGVYQDHFLDGMGHLDKSRDGFEEPEVGLVFGFDSDGGGRRRGQ